MLTKCCHLFLLLFLLCCGHMETVYAAPDSVVTVGAASGSLSVRRKGLKTTAPLISGQSLAIGDTVFTGAQSKASLIFPDGAQVRLNANTVLEVTPPRRVRGGNLRLFRVIAGQIWARLRPGNAVETRTAVLGVRGTEVLVAVAPDGSTTLTVTDGSVDFYNEFGEVLVGQSQQSVARPGTAPTAPITIQNAGFIVEWTLELDRAVIPREKFFISLDRKTVALEAARRGAAARENSQDASRRRDYGDALFDLGRYEDASREYIAALQLTPQDVELSTRVGYALLEAGHVNRAERSFLLALNGNKAPIAPQVQSIGLDWKSVMAMAEDSPNSALFLQASRRISAAPTLVGLASLALARDRPLEAQKVAQLAVDANAELVEARVALGVSLLRQPGRLDDSITVLKSALSENSGDKTSRYNYQAHAWLSLAYLGQDDRSSALREAKKAVQLAPNSGLSHGNLALAYFFSGDPRKSAQEGRLALQFNPESVAARVALGQAALAQGDVDTANKAAAQAVALDPDLPQARYLLGLSDAGRRDYRHATRELQEAVRLAPEFLAAGSALARVYTLVGRNDDATALLTNMLPRHRQADAVLGALGAVYYQQGLYEKSAQSYQDAIAKKPNSALYQAELSRTLLGSNRLNQAIEAGRAAVRLAPEVGQYHAILGQAYEFSRLPSQAEREFRTALTLDPQNALALTQLAYRHSAADLRPAAAGFAQGFLLDPGISRQLMRGGTRLETTPSVSSQGEQNLALSHRENALDGKFQSFGFLARGTGESFREGARQGENPQNLDASENFTYQASPRTNLYANLRLKQNKQNLLGAVSAPDSDDNADFAYSQAQIAARHRLGTGNYLWAGLFANSSRSTIQDPRLNSFFDPTTGFNISRQNFTSRAFEPEMRLDLALGQSQRAGTLTLGLAKTSTRFRSNRDLQFTSPSLFVATGNGDFNQNDSGMLAYGQIAQRFGTRLSLIAQLRLQRQARDANALVSLSGTPLGQGAENSSHNHLLPSFLATYQPSKRTTLRLALNQRISDVTASNFAPTETLLTTERSSLPFGTPENVRLAQLDLERSVSSRGFLKLFLFRTSADNVQVGFSDLLGFGGGLPAAQAPGLQIAKWRGAGAGVRYEHQIDRHFFANFGAVMRRTTSFSDGPVAANFDGQSAPYEANFGANFDLNYLDERGRKVGVRLRHVGAFFEDSPLALGRSRFAPQTYVDVSLAREFSLQAELFLSVTNLFDQSQIEFKDFPIGKRRVNFGVTRRF